MASLINIGMSGLGANQSALHTIGNNIANADVSGYSRQQTVQSTKGSLQNGQVFVGTGTTLADVRRVYNVFLDNQLRTSTSLDADTTAFLDQVAPLDKLLSDTSTGITGALQGFFTALQGASAKPTEDASRQLLLSSAETLSKRFNSIASQLSEQNSNLNGNLASMASQVNKLTASIAQFNDQISRVSAVNGSPNDLLDARNEAVRQLSELIGSQVVERDGNFDVYLSNGQPLVMGNTFNTLSVAPGATDPSHATIQLNRGQTTMDVTSTVTGGSIGGLLRYRNEVLDSASNELGRVALVLADRINSQLAQGIDKNGEFGSSLFGDINSAALVSQRSIAKAGNSAGSGNLDVSISDTSKLTTNDYQVTFTSATGYSVKRLPDGTNMGSYDLSTTPPPVIDGFSLKLNGGALSAGDSFKITPTRSAAADIRTVLTDPKKIALAGPLTAVSGSGNAGTGTITQPVLTSKLDIYNPTAQLQLQTGLKYSTPVKLVFGDDTLSPQGYELFDAKGNSLGTGNILPGQSNTLSLNVPMVDASGNPIMNGAVQQTYSFEMTVGGVPKTNDSYTISLTGAGSADNRNALSTLELQTKATVDISSTNKGVSLTDAYGKLVENVGGKAKQGQMDSAATGAILTQAKSARESVSGVDLDEETGNLIKYQQYYTASSQIIKAAQDIFNTLISSL
ncbi:flagellar hook-associated protein FlgK [Pseudomonas akapageensis]|uniref:flagellar hook-associated protein FlgK n=1 Tax=Pseudomonas akapageensis TaxID=2609961 RepID=UPI00140CFBC8|nr:flagellar hook-associated protein FlgK [Pseudomonas akapageensis]